VLLQCVAVCCSVLQCVAVWFEVDLMCCSSVLQCVAVCCSVVCGRSNSSPSFLNQSDLCIVKSVLQCVAVCCSVLQCVAVCYSVLHRISARPAFSSRVICVLSILVISLLSSRSPLVLFGRLKLPPPRGGSASRVCNQFCQLHAAKCTRWGRGPPRLGSM